jgi:hypothetical protein
MLPVYNYTLQIYIHFIYRLHKENIIQNDDIWKVINGNLWYSLRYSVLFFYPYREEKIHPIILVDSHPS